MVKELFNIDMQKGLNIFEVKLCWLGPIYFVIVCPIPGAGQNKVGACMGKQAHQNNSCIFTCFSI